MPFYAVRFGKCPGIYDTWDKCKTQVIGFKGAIYKKFSNKDRAIEFVNNNSKIYNTHTKGKSNKQLTNIAKANKLTKQPNTLYIFTDGSSVNNGTKYSNAGYGIYIPEPYEYNIMMRGKLPNGTTNNYAELKAILEALCLHDYNELRHKSKCIDNPIENIVIVTDSTYSINCITKWSTKWKQNNWCSSTGDTVKNKTLIQKIYMLYIKYKPKFLHINSHTGRKGFFYEGNQIADKLANGTLK